MNIAQVLQYLYPDADAMKDYIVQDDGEGAYIKKWNLAEPQPTQAELEAAWPDAQAEIGKEKRIIDTRLDEIDKLSIRSLRAKGNSRDNQSDRDRLIALDDEAVVLRIERDTLSI